MTDDAPCYTNSPEHAQQLNRLASGSGPMPNLRSCATCRRRKVKCDKKLPCSNCVRGKIECVFPGPGRAPRRSRKPQDSELLERLRRLEGVVSSLNAQVEEHEHDVADQGRATLQSSAREQQRAYPGGHEINSVHSSPNTVVDTSVEDLGHSFDRLVVEKGRSRYIANGFWTSLNNEMEDLKAILVEPSNDEEEDVNTPDSAHHSSQHQCFIFGYSSTMVDMHSLRPAPDQARQFWEIYKESVEPVAKVLHIPTFERTFHDAISHPDKVSKALETLLFVIYYGAVTSSTDEECIDRWGTDRTYLLKNYRFGLEQALARANFLYCNDMVVLQAYVIFLVLLRRNDHPRMIWTLTGLATRIAQTLGIHKDGTHFQLPPFEVEMRRRLWWQIYTLDGRSTEDHGISSMYCEMPFDAKMPLNINDSDLDPDMVDLPEERQGFTDMTLTLMRCEFSLIFRQILPVPIENVKTTDFVNLSIADKEKYINDCEQRIENKYFKNSDMSIPLCWVAATATRVIFSKLWLNVYHPQQRKDGGASLPEETKNRLFITSLESLEGCLLVECEPRTKKWRWHFHTYIQWHAIAFLLSELSIRTRGAAVERAWRVLEETASQWWGPLSDEPSNHKQGLVWKPIKRLLKKARAARDRELALERASQALRNGQFAYNNYAQMMSVPILSTEQPNPENLDSLLRPIAPGLGEVSVATPSTWPADTPTPDAIRAFSPETSHMTVRSRGMTNGGVNSTSKNSSNLQPAFHDILNFGFDNVVGNVLDEVVFDGTSFNNTSNLFPSFTPNLSQRPANTTLPSNITNSINMTNEINMTNDINLTNGMNMTNSINGNFPPFGNNMFPNINTSPMTNNSDSPNMEGGHMDWTVWDDMLSQLGLEGPNADGGLVPWL